MDVESRHAFWATMREFASRGKTVLFATHYLEEADDFADRVVLMAARHRRRRRAADGDQGDGRARARSARRCRTSPTRRARARCRASRAPSGAASRSCSPATDSDAAIRALLERFPDARDIEISGAGLEEAFLELTAATANERDRLRQVRAPADVPEPAVHLPLARLPARPLLPDRGAEPARAEPRRLGHLRAALLHGRPGRVRLHERDASRPARGSPPSARSAGTASCG